MFDAIACFNCLKLVYLDTTMDTWTPEDQREWQRRWDASEDDSIERQNLMAMQYDGFYRPTEVSSLPASPTSPFVQPALPPKPPLRPIKAVDPQRELFYLNRTSTVSYTHLTLPTKRIV